MHHNTGETSAQDARQSLCFHGHHAADSVGTSKPTVIILSRSMAAWLLLPDRTITRLMSTAALSPKPD